LLHGPAELLPISSSGHLGAIPWLLGWTDRDQPGLGKSFDVALHGGATAAWLLAPRDVGQEILHDLRQTSRRPWFLALAVGLPGAAGLMLEDPIERRLGTPATIAAGLVAGSLLMLAAERTHPSRAFDEASARDGLWLGLAQASALLPGVSRSGAALAVARIRGWDRGDSRRLASAVGLPVIAGATVLKGLRMVRRPPGPDDREALVVGAGASFGSAWLLAPGLSRWSANSLRPCAIYRLTLALAILARRRGGA
jgi:undecaprenyl-diphosphatase